MSQRKQFDLTEALINEKKTCINLKIDKFLYLYEVETSPSLCVELLLIGKGLRGQKFSLIIQ